MAPCKRQHVSINQCVLIHDFWRLSKINPAFDPYLASAWNAYFRVVFASAKFNLNHYSDPSATLKNMTMLHIWQLATRLGLVTPAYSLAVTKAEIKRFYQKMVTVYIGMIGCATMILSQQKPDQPCFMRVAFHAGHYFRVLVIGQHIFSNGFSSHQRPKWSRNQRRAIVTLVRQLGLRLQNVYFAKPIQG